MTHLVHIQGLRALAALAIVYLHANVDAGILAAATGSAFAPLQAFPWLAGVDVFFVISGFIMVHASGRLFEQPGAARMFLARRIARVVPLYWAVTSLFLAVALLAPGLVRSDAAGAWPILASYLFVPIGASGEPAMPVYSLGWTLNYEMFFYALFALVIGLPRRLAVAALTLGLSAVVAAGAAWNAVVAPLPQPFAFWSDAIVLEFAFGMLLGLARAEGVRLSALPRVALAASALAILSLDLALSEPHLHRAIAYGLPAALLVAAAGLGRTEPKGRGLFARFANAAGDASYALYLVHPFVIRALREVLIVSGLAPAVGPHGLVFLALAASLLAALVVHRLFEKPATALVRRLTEGRHAPEAVTARPGSG